MLLRHMFTTAIALGLFAVIGTALVALTFSNTEERIAENERLALLRSLHELVPPRLHDNPLSEDTLIAQAPELLGSKKPVTIYQARKYGQPVAVILAPIAPDGYNGDIKLLVAIDQYGLLMGVRIVSHHETPGLGDAIDIERSDWIESFNGYAVDNPGSLGWRVEKDGGIFDQFTGATITPRAVVKAVHKTLQYFEAHKETLLARPEDRAHAPELEDHDD
jgi:electron transport complex protein RnfG